MMKKKDEFVPYLKDEDTGTFYGKIGTPTKMKDIAGQPLFVGDVVEVTEKGIVDHSQKSGQRNEKNK